MGKFRLISFLLKISEYPNLFPSHRILLITLLSIYQQERYVIPFQIFRRKVKHVEKVLSIVTYHKCIKELVNLGYILYRRSYNPIKENEVYLTEQLMG